jgi:polar amino acid transport system permease protein
LNYTFNISAITANTSPLIDGALNTVLFSGTAMILGLAIGIMCAYLRVYTTGIASFSVKVYVEAIRNTPFLVQLFFLFFGLPAMGVRLDPNQAAIVALTINLGAYATEIIRAGIESIPPSQIEAAEALGISRRHIFTRVVLLQALEKVQPALSSQFVFLMLSSSLAYVISAQELTSAAAYIDSQTYRSFEIYFFVTILYILLAFGFRAVFYALGKVVFSGRLTYQAGQ